jgi:hypothetical protein
MEPSKAPRLTSPAGIGGAAAAGALAKLKNIFDLIELFIIHEGKHFLSWSIMRLIT